MADTLEDTSVEEVGTTPAISADEYERATGEALARTLDLATWESNTRLAESLAKLEAEVAAAAKDESALVHSIRADLFPRIGKRPGAPVHAGVYQATTSHIEAAQQTLLFNGLTEACDATSVLLDTLALKVVQIGVGLVSYSGKDMTLSHRIYRRDMRVKQAGLVEEAIEILERRRLENEGGSGGAVSDMLRRAIMTYAERAVLVERATAPWRMGHGNPLAYELLTGSGLAALIDPSLVILDRLLEQKKFAFVTSDTNRRELLTIGNALKPLECAIVDDVAPYLDKVLGGHYTGEWVAKKGGLTEFAATYGHKVLIGVYRVSGHSPPRMFYAHADHVHEAALLLMADSILQEHRGFPMLIDIADTLCGNYFGSETLMRPAQAAFAELGEPYRYLPERSTRNN
ncbi:MAG: hypothetical protein AB1744_12105 [Candidatus Zixiibacteriota bacterium]